MAIARVRNIRRVPGRLFKDPVSLTTPDFGTPLGIFGAMEFRPNIQTTSTVDETLSRTISTRITAEQGVLAGVLRDFDPDALALLFPNTKQGKRSLVINGRAAGSGVNRSGFDMRDRAFKLLFVPLRSVNLEDHILFYNAVPVIEETAALQLSLQNEKDLAVMFEAQPDADLRDYDIGRLDDLEFP